MTNRGIIEILGAKYPYICVWGYGHFTLENSVGTPKTVCGNATNKYNKNLIQICDKNLRQTYVKNMRQTFAETICDNINE